MQYRTLGKTGFQVSTISFGAWAISGSWGTVDDQTSLAALHRAIDLGINFIDTENARAADLPPLSEEAMRTVQAVYDRDIRALVHGLW